MPIINIDVYAIINTHNDIDIHNDKNDKIMKMIWILIMLLIIILMH